MLSSHRVTLRVFFAWLVLTVFSAHLVMAATDDDDSDKNKKAKKTSKSSGDDKSSDETPRKRTRSKDSDNQKDSSKSDKDSGKTSSSSKTAKSSDKDKSSKEKDKDKESTKTPEKSSSKVAKSSDKDSEKSNAKSSEKTKEKAKGKDEDKDSAKTASKSSDKEKRKNSEKSSSKEKEKEVVKEDPDARKPLEQIGATRPVSKKGDDSSHKTAKDVTSQKADRTGDEGEFGTKSSEELAMRSESKPAERKESSKTVTTREMQGWEIVHYQDRDYVTSSSIHRFYRFTDHRIEGNVVWFTSPVLIMKAVIGSQELLINNIKFILSNPVEEVGGKVIFSRLDLCKLIDPVLRPSYIGRAEPFDTVIVDAGHGGYDSGARGLYGYEKNFTLQLAGLLRADLEKRGLKVVMTRSDDTFISLGGRVEIANKVPNSIFVSLHFNSGQSLATGIETYALSPQGSSSDYGARSVDALAFNGNQRDSENIALATAIHASVVHHFKLVDRGVKRARWYVLTGLERPGVLFEGGFVTNGADGQLIAANNFRADLAHTIGEAIMNYRRALQPPSR